MRNTSQWKRGIVKQLRPQWPKEASLSPELCCEVELGFSGQARLLPGERTDALWVLLTGYPFPLTQAAHWTEQEQWILQVLRYVLPHFKSYQGWRRAVERYTQLPARLRIYEVDKDGFIISQGSKVSIGANRTGSVYTVTTTRT